MGITREQALDCFRSDDLVGIGMEADAVRRRLHPEGVVSYIIDRGIDCTALAGTAGETAGALLDSVCGEIGETVEMGGTGVRLAGGAGGAGRGGSSGIEWLEELLRGIRRRFPSIWIEGMAAREVAALARSCGSGLSGSGLSETIARLRAAGLDSIAGDGAVVSDERGVQEWIGVHRAAHGLGMRTTAAMIFGAGIGAGAGETIEQRVDFLEAVRRLQEETGGFAAFVPVAAEAPGGRELDGVTAVERLKTLAISRMFLDNIENVQSIGAAQGLKVLQMGLRFGANDAGPVSAESGGSEEDVRRIIRDAGFMPVQRDMVYRTMMLN